MVTKQITVVTACVIKNDEILLLQRNEPECPDAHHRWELPGGKVEFGETIEEAIVREIKEEAGVTAKIKNLLPLAQTIYWEYEWGTQQTLLLCYACEFLSESKINKDHHVEQIAWIKLGEIQKLHLIKGASEFIEAAIAI